MQLTTGFRCPQLSDRGDNFRHPDGHRTIKFVRLSDSRQGLIFPGFFGVKNGTKHGTIETLSKPDRVGAIAMPMRELPVLSSTLFLTLLLFVGLWFFIRASVKERIEQMEFTSDRPVETLYSELIQYFEQRAYRPLEQEYNQHQIQFEGFVRPSVFLAIFLSVLAACGLFCLGLVLAYAMPVLGAWPLWGSILSPGAGYFYWRKAGRREQVQIKITLQPDQKALVWVAGHRDELAQLRQHWGAI